MQVSLVGDVAMFEAGTFGDARDALFGCREISAVAREFCTTVTTIFQ